MSSESTRAAERVVLAFQERYWSDEAEGGPGTLASYLDIYREHQELVAREYMALQSGAAKESSGGVEGLDRIGPYLLEDEIGRGGQGLVYRAQDTRLGRTVALKVLSGLGPGAEKQIARFKREAEVAARLEHPGICGVHDAGVENGVPYIAMRYVKGETLAQRISRTRQESHAATTEEPSFLDLSETGDELADENTDRAASTSVTTMGRSQFAATLTVFEKAARALHAAHEAGVVHRDVKPGNIMITAEGEPVLLDFGLASDESADSHSLTMTGDLFGTPAYMSPEQIAGQRIHLDARSDVYSLGVTLYESLTLRRPWEAPTREALYQAIMTKEAPDPRRFNKAISKDLKVVLECALEKDRDKRYVSAHAFADDLAAVREGLPVAASSIGPFGRFLRWSKRRPMRAALFLVLVLGIPLITGLSGFIFANLDKIKEQKAAVAAQAVEELISRGYFEMAAVRDDRGLAEFETALERSPDSTEALAGIVLFHTRQRQELKALEVLKLRRASVSRPELLDGLEAYALRRAGRFDEAKAIEVKLAEPNDALSWFISGLLEMENLVAVTDSPSPKAKERLHRVRVRFERAVHAAPSGRLSYTLSLAAAAATEFDLEGFAVAADAIESRWGDSAEVQGWLGTICEQVDTKRAIDSYRIALKASPESFDLRCKLARAMTRLGQMEEARELVATLLQEQRPEGRENTVLAEVLETLGDIPAATEEFERVVAAEPDSAFHRYAFYSFLMNRGMLEEAADQLRQALALSPDLQVAIMRLAEVLRELERYEEAETLARRAIALDSTDWHPHVTLARISLQRGEHDRVPEQVEIARSCEPGNDEAQQWAGRLYYEIGQLDKAIATYEDTIRHNPEALLCRKLLASALKKRGDYDEALKAYEAYLEIRPDDAKVVASLMLLCAETGRFDYVLSLSERARALDPESTDILAPIVMAYANLGRREEARSVCLEAIERDPESAIHHDNFVLLCDLEQEPELRLRHERESVRLDPTRVESQLLLLLDLMKVGGFEEAERVGREALKLAPDHSDIGRLFGLALVRNGRFEEGLSFILKVFEENPADSTNAATLAGAIDAAVMASAAHDIVDPLRAAVARQPGAFELRLALARVEFVDGAEVASLEQAQAALGLRPGDARALILLSSCLTLNGRFEEAEDTAFAAYLASVESGVATTQNSPVVKLASGALGLRIVLLLCEGRIDEAEEHLRGRAAENPEFLLPAQVGEVVAQLRGLEVDQRLLSIRQLFNARVQGMLAAGQSRAAMEFAKRHLVNDPGNSMAQNLVAWLKVDPEGKADLHDPRGALPHARRCVELTQRENAGFLDTLAVTHFALGEVENAVQVQEEILRLMNGKDVGSYKFADAQALLEKYRLALRAGEARQ